MRRRLPPMKARELEALGLKVDPVEETLEHSRPFGPAALSGYIPSLLILQIV